MSGEPYYDWKKENPVQVVALATHEWRAFVDSGKVIIAPEPKFHDAPDFDVWLYVTGNFAGQDHMLQYAQELAALMNKAKAG